MTTSAERQMANGAVTFLDVLGWKGIWLRLDHKEVVRQLDILVRKAENVAKEQRGRITTASVRILSISDTIVLLTEGDVAAAVTIHGLICRDLVSESIRLGIPLRGATSHGQFFASTGTSLVGPAVDEAANWHEALDWIGVVLTPSAEYKHSPVDPWFLYQKVPIKGLGAKSMWCVDWTDNWNNEDELKKQFSETGPIDLVVAPKYMNTIEFLRDRISNRPKPPRSAKTRKR